MKQTRSLFRDYLGRSDSEPEPREEENHDALSHLHPSLLNGSDPNPAPDPDPRSPITPARTRVGSRNPRPNTVPIRVFSKEDEILILHGLIDHLDRNRSAQSINLTELHRSIAGRLSGDPNPNQLKAKIRKLRKNFSDNSARPEWAPRGSHQRLVYQVSKLVWGGEIPRWGEGLNFGTRGRKARRRARIENRLEETGPAREGDDMAVVRSMVPEIVGLGGGDGGMGRLIKKVGSEIFRGPAPASGAGEWWKLLVKDVELHRREMEIKVEKAKLVLNELEPSLRPNN
ncbi:DNA-binding storekeeper protein-relatedtranscriptional regulator [Striga asiatica]|uniref:DNA-binding storekeeper protein-relatedtranscriptional regulator n=1 Tax=Striga asiatica TaxID=4170 RepID=A0A5A7PG45_STRAF|nr:DNA-binding storekeeper protein-relatedtranscriptional regulator [Striga asiatica]